MWHLYFLKSYFFILFSCRKYDVHLVLSLMLWFCDYVYDRRTQINNFGFSSLSLNIFSYYMCNIFVTARIRFKVGLIRRVRKGFRARATSHLSAHSENRCRSAAGTLLVCRPTVSLSTTESSYR